jgi:hypothetical protein
MSSVALAKEEAHAKADGGALEILGIFCLLFATIQTIIPIVAQGISNH